MPAQLPMHLVQLESLPSALDLLRYLANHAEEAAFPEEMMEDLAISERRYSKAMRRLVTNSYTQMLPDNRFELTHKGISAAEELAVYDADAPTSAPIAQGSVERDLIVAVPFQLAAGEPAEILVGFEPMSSSSFARSTEVVLRFEAIHASLSVRDESVTLDSGALVQRLMMTPSFYDQARLKVQVFQISEDGEDLSDCGGLYVDLDVVASQPNTTLVAYNSSVTLSLA